MLRTRLRSCSWRVLQLVMGLGVAFGSSAGAGNHSWEIEAVMPEHPAPAESYLCMRVDLPDASSLKLVGVEPLSKEELVHHMLLYGCQKPTNTQGVWPCQGHGVCPSGGNQQILYGWAKGAPPVRLPHGVGYRVGSGTQISNLVLQIHFAVERPKQDLSGIRVHLSSAHVPFSAGMLMYASYFEIPPQKQQHLIPTRCCYAGFEPAHGFAFRVHTHMLGRSVFLDEITGKGEHLRVVEHDPQLPQGFTPVSRVTFWPGQTLEATCDFNSMERNTPTYAGATHHNEMCNLYMMLWSELPIFMSCYGHQATMDRNGPGGLPRPAVLIPEKAKHWTVGGSNDASSSSLLGQIAGVAKGHNGTVWVFHRADRIWDANSFKGPRGEHTTFKEPIKQDTVLQLDQDTGEILKSWGSNSFYMPHMITIDRWGFLWLTDVALHQVFKYDVSGKLLMVLGTALAPGEGISFCKPTHVEIGNDGSVYVSDGYCNARVAHFNANGTHLGDYKLEKGAISIPHSLVLEECNQALVVADREASHVHRFHLETRKHIGSWDLTKEGFVYGLAAGPYGTLFALCWQRQKVVGSAARLVLLHSDPGQGVEEGWQLPGVDAPHDLAVIAAPGRLAGTERPLAVLVAETRMAGSKLHKFIVMPAGTAVLPASPDADQLGSATAQWAAVYAASEQSGNDSSGSPHGAFQAARLEREIWPPIGSHKQLHHREGSRYRLNKIWDGSSRHFLMLAVPVLILCGGVVFYYRLALRR